MKLTLQVLIR